MTMKMDDLDMDEFFLFFFSWILQVKLLEVNSEFKEVRKFNYLMLIFWNAQHDLDFVMILDINSPVTSSPRSQSS